MKGSNRIGPLSLGRRPYRVVCGVLAVASVGVGGTGAYLASQWNRTTEVALTDVLEDFREDTPSPDVTAAPVGVPTPDPAVAVDPAVGPATEASPTDGGARPVPDPDPVATDPTTPPLGGEVPGPGPAPAGPVPFTRPAEGVYTYAATGGESISVGGARHDYPGQVFATLTHTGCGYQLRVHVLQEHIDTLDFCIDGLRLGFHRSHQRLTFIGNTAEGSFSCDPWIGAIDRAVGPGAQDSRSCTAGTVGVDRSTATHVADEPVRVDDADVVGSRVVWQWFAESGESTGSGEQVWVFDENGLPLIIERTGTTTAPSVLGRATHQETARFVLQSRTPQR